MLDEIILYSIVGLLCFCGLISVISAVCSWFYNAGGGAGECIVLPVKGHMEDIEFRIRGAMVRRRRASRRLSKIYLADFGADDETAEIARRICGEFDVLEWVDGTELTKRLRENVNAENKK